MSTRHSQNVATALRLETSWLGMGVALVAANAVFHLWWLDSAAALVLVPFLLKEAREAISGECACTVDKQL